MVADMRVVDLALQEKLVGVIVPTVGWAIVREGQLCHTRAGLAHIYAEEAQAQATLAGIGHPATHRVVAVMIADRTRVAEVTL